LLDKLKPNRRPKMADKELEIQDLEIEESVVEEALDEALENTTEEDTTEVDSENLVETKKKNEEEDEDDSDDDSEDDSDDDSEEDDDDMDEDGHDKDDEDKKKMNASYSKKEGWKKGKKMAKEDIDVKEHIDAMLNGQELTEEFKDKAKTIFEAAVLDKINEEVERLENQYAETLEENLVEIRQEISEKVDEYLTYVAKEWLEENKLSVENGLKLDIMENFIKGLKTVFTENYIDIPEEKIDLYQESVKSLEETQEKLNSEIEKNVKLHKSLTEAKREIVFTTVTEDLTLSQKEKIRSLSEGVEFVSEEDFSGKLKTIRENYFPENSEVDSEVLDESTEETAVEDSPVVIQEEASKKPVNRTMDIYTQTLSRFTKK
jgi:hypothetical protein